MANEIQLALPRINLSASMRDLLHDVRVAQGSLGAQIERLERIEREMLVLMGSCPPTSGGPIGPGTVSVAYNLDMRSRPDGSVVVSIDGGGRFSLAARLAEVFRFLASGDKQRGGNDDLVGWRSREEINKFLNESAGKILRASYVNNLVYLLKKALCKAGYDRSLIQTHRQKGIRLALKHCARTQQGFSSASRL
jgi:hypothetical protein